VHAEEKAYAALASPENCGCSRSTTGGGTAQRTDDYSDSGDVIEYSQATTAVNHTA
jgi:hypothetical protein